jgi:glycosyltransferase involved in cell wall biosynthesis
MGKGTSYIIITPVRDEERHIMKTLESVSSQQILPEEWIIVDDGSRDQTGKILDEYSKGYPWIKVLHRKDRGFRQPGTGVIEAFYEGYEKIRAREWEFLVKLDGDLSFPPDYFEKCFSHFKADHSLGIGGGLVMVYKNGKLVIDSPHDPPFHVRGATKIYRRPCWEKISPLLKSPGWDTIDEVKANMLGWSTRTFHDLKIVQHKLTGEGDGSWRNWFKNGLGNYITGYHPLFMLGKCIKRATKRPYLLASLALFMGFCSGYVKHIPQVDDKRVINYLRQQQLRKLMMKPSIYG